MPLFRNSNGLLRRLTALAVLVGINAAPANETAPAEAWSRAYSWLQAGERLAESDQWALTMGAYIETFRQMKAIRNASPSYEPELVNYRIEKLEEMIEETEPKLPPGGNLITMKFLDFIESYDLGMEQRFSGQFSEALATLDIAKVILDEIIFENPDEFRDAVDTQYTILHDSIGFLEQQISYRARKPRQTYVSDGIDWGTTEFVKGKDLPTGGDEILMSGSLFPRGPDPATIRGISSSIPELTEKKEPAEMESEKKNSGPPGFRMSSKQKEVPVIEGE